VLGYDFRMCIWPLCPFTATLKFLALIVASFTAALALCFYLPVPGGVQSVVTNMSVCLSVRSHISKASC